jgi:hypothetical protein
VGSKISTSQGIGLALIGIGAVLMFVVGFILSWWYVPAIREQGFNNVPFPTALNILWGASAPLGAILVAIGAALYAQVGRARLLVLIVGSVVLTGWIILWRVSEVPSVLFGIDGGLIVVFFLGLLWNWSRSRPALSASERTGSDLQMLGHVFFLIAAWYLCGVFGAPLFALRPELAQQFSVSPSATASLASLISICLVLGWAFTFLGHRMVLRSRQESHL